MHSSTPTLLESVQQIQAVERKKLDKLAAAVRQIGIDYLSHFPKKSLFHSNQVVASKMRNLEENLSKEEIKRNLIAFYLSLPNTNGKLAHAIEDFFTETLEEVLDEKQIDAYWKSKHIASAAAELIGVNYLQRHRLPGIFRFHTNQHFARQIRDLPADMPQADLEDKLVNYYIQLPNLHGELAASIRDFFEKFLGKPLTQQMMVQNISLETYQKIGAEYLEKYPTTTKRFMFNHTNQEYATALKTGVEYGTNRPLSSSGTAIWKALLEVYKYLPFNNGWLANRIERILINVFNVTFDDVKQIGNTRAAAAVTREHIARDVYRRIEPVLKKTNTFQA